MLSRDPQFSRSFDLKSLLQFNRVSRSSTIHFISRTCAIIRVA